MDKIRIGVMGCANIAKRSVIPAILQLKELFELKAIASRTHEKANDFASAFNVIPVVGYENLIDRNDIDAIYMPLPTGLHEEWITKALQSGKHVLAEKSLATDYATAQKLVELARSKSLLLMENFMFRYHSQHQMVWSHLKEGNVGSIRLFRSQFGFPPLSQDNFRYSSEDGGGSLLDAGAYTIRASSWFLGKGLKVMSATLYVDPVKKVDIYGNANLQSMDGIVAQVSFGFDNYYQCNYEFWGSMGRIYANKAFTPKIDEKPTISIEMQSGKNLMEMQPDNHFAKILQEFHKSIKGCHHSEHLEDILEQSRILDEIKNKATIIRL